MGTQDSPHETSRNGRTEWKKVGVNTAEVPAKSRGLFHTGVDRRSDHVQELLERGERLEGPVVKGAGEKVTVTF